MPALSFVTRRLPILALVLGLALQASLVASSALTTTIAANERTCFYALVDKAGEKVGFYFAVSSNNMPLWVSGLVQGGCCCVCGLGLSACLGWAHHSTKTSQLNVHPLKEWYGLSNANDWRFGCAGSIWWII